MNKKTQPRFSSFVGWLNSDKEEYFNMRHDVTFVPDQILD